MNFIDYSIASWQHLRTLCFRLQCVDSYFHVLCAMPRKTANEIVSSLHKLDLITSRLKCLPWWCRACIITIFTYTNHIVECWVVVEHCNMKTRKIINLNRKSSNIMIESWYCRTWKQSIPIIIMLKKMIKKNWSEIYQKKNGDWKRLKLFIYIYIYIYRK
mgnify:CR=1 FL=1